MSVDGSMCVDACGCFGLSCGADRDEREIVTWNKDEL
jgi:hypothetical protein